MNIHIHVCTPVCTRTRAHTSKEWWNEITSKSTKRFFKWSKKDLSSCSEYLLSTFPHGTLEPLPGGCVTATMEGWAFQWAACGDQTLHKLFSITVKGSIANQLRGKSCISHWLDTWLCASFQPPLGLWERNCTNICKVFERCQAHLKYCLSITCHSCAMQAWFLFIATLFVYQTCTALSRWFHDKSRFRGREVTQSIACLASIRTWVQPEAN